MNYPNISAHSFSFPKSWFWTGNLSLTLSIPLPSPRSLSVSWYIWRSQHTLGSQSLLSTLSQAGCFLCCSQPRSFWGVSYLPNLSTHMSTRITDTQTNLSGFYVDSRVLNSGPHTFLASDFTLLNCS